MTFECENCGKTSTTEAGLALHMKVYHSDTKSTVKKTKEPAKSAPKKASKSKSKGKEVELTIEQITKLKIDRYESVKKRFKQKPTGIKNNDTVKKAQLQKIFPAGITSRLLGESQEVDVHSYLESSYKAIVLTNDKGWSRVRLIGNATKITWAEGPMPKGKYKVTYPNVSKR